MGKLLGMLFVLVAVFILCISAASAGSRISIGNAHASVNIISVGITNMNDYDIDNARVRVFIPELGIISCSATVDLDDDETVNARMYIGSVPEGMYIARVSVKKGSERKVAYRYVFFD